MGNYKKKLPIMRQLTIFLLTILPTITFGQYEYGFLQETYFGRQPSARAEAMGKGYCAIDGDLTSIFFNPAGISSINGFEIDGSFSSPCYLAPDAKYSFVSLGYKINNYLTIGLSRNKFILGKDIITTDVNGNSYGPYTPYNSNSILTLSSEPVKNLFFGLNTNYFTWHPLDKSATAIYFDFGVIKKFQFAQNKTIKHSINIGASITNLNYSKLTLNTYIGNLPVITRYGANYQFTFDRHLLIDTLKTLGLLLQGEYKVLLNSQYNSGIHVGCEINVLEIISFRLGYYKEKEYDFNIPTYNNNEISAFTYGVGIQIPLYKLTKIPLKVSFDYTSLPQVSYSKIFTSWDNFTTYNLRLNWILHYK